MSTYAKYRIVLQEFNPGMSGKVAPSEIEEHGDDEREDRSKPTFVIDGYFDKYSPDAPAY